MCGLNKGGGGEGKGCNGVLVLVLGVDLVVEIMAWVVYVVGEEVVGWDWGGYAVL